MKRVTGVIVLSFILICFAGISVTLYAITYDARVYQVQQKLKELGYDPGPIDGFWGGETKAAVKKFQADQGLAVTGKLDKATQNKLGLPDSVETAKGKKGFPQKTMQLRSSPAVLSPEDIVQMIQASGFHHPDDYSHLGLSRNITGTIQHEYEAKTLLGDQVVLDHLSSLMWQKTGSMELLKGDEVRQHVEQVNAQGFAGFSDWRLPTIEELASLLEKSQKNGSSYIDPAFEEPMWFCLSADNVKNEDAEAWAVDFSGGYVMNFMLDNEFYILLVRSNQ